MLSRFWPKLVAASFALIFCVAAIQAWRADRRDRAQLAAELTATKQLLVAADARQRDRDSQLSQTLSALDAQKRAILTPSQIVQELAKNIPLPAPITLQAPQTSSVGATLGSPATNTSNATASGASPVPTSGSSTTTTATSPQPKQKPTAGAVIPAADLKPFYDFSLDCQACQARLSVAQNDLADEKAKTAGLTKERDDAIRVAKGGSAWRRFGRAAKWFAIGAAAGAIASKTAH